MAFYGAADNVAGLDTLLAIALFYHVAEVAFRIFAYGPDQYWNYSAFQGAELFM